MLDSNYDNCRYFYGKWRHYINHSYNCRVFLPHLHHFRLRRLPGILPPPSASNCHRLELYTAMETSNGHLIHHQCSSSFASSRRDVTYSCGSCGFELNLSSSSRNTSTIGSKYGKSIKKGIISFFSIDESRFNLVKDFHCVPFFSKHSWGLFRPRTKLLCRKCGNLIGNADDENVASYRLIRNGLGSSSVSENSNQRKYDIRIRALQPSAEFGTPLSC